MASAADLAAKAALAMTPTVIKVTNTMSLIWGEDERRSETWPKRSEPWVNSSFSPARATWAERRRTNK